MTVLDQRVIEQAQAAYLRASKWLNRGRKVEGSKLVLGRESADDVLRRNGITIDGDRAEYLAYEQAIRHGLYESGQVARSVSVPACARRLSPEDREKLRELIREGVPQGDIVDIMGVSPTTVRGYRREVAGV